MGGLDLALGSLVEKAKDILGDDTIIVVSSDNGGSVWFGGLNAPLRSGKHTSFEGGVRVPAFALDLSGGVHLGPGGRDYPHMVHVSDWLPTFLQAAGIVAELLAEVEVIKAGRPYTPRYWMVSNNWTEGFVEGDCSGQDVLPAEFCRFTGPWLPDTADLKDEEGLGLKDIAAEATREMRNQVLAVILVASLSCLAFWKMTRRNW